MPPGQLSGLLPCLSREKRPPPVSTSVKAFRHFIDGSLALASPDHTCRNLVPAFLQRSPQPLLTAAACSGLGLHLTADLEGPTLISCIAPHLLTLAMCS